MSILFKFFKNGLVWRKTYSTNSFQANFWDFLSIRKIPRSQPYISTTYLHIFQIDKTKIVYKYKYSTSKRHLKEIIKSRSCSFQCVKYTTASNLSIFLEKRNCEISFRFKAKFMFIIKRKYANKRNDGIIFFNCPGTSSYADELTGPLGQTHVQHHNRPHDRLHDQHHDWQKL